MGEELDRQDGRPTLKRRIGVDDSEAGAFPPVISDEVLSIQMLGTVDSLNVSVAAGMVLYEVGRQRGSSPHPNP